MTSGGKIGEKYLILKTALKNANAKKEDRKCQ